jgi:gliding motility-associated-like protein
LKKALPIIVFAFYASFAFCQNETAKWYFGNYAGLDFTTNPPTVLTNGTMAVVGGCASVADASGNLLFYTNGVTIWTASHTVMANGSGLLGGGFPMYTQSCLITKRPGSVSEYYIFTVKHGTGFHYSIVDMSLASGQGSVTTKNSVLYSGFVCGKLTGAKHCNGSDYWIVVRDWLSNSVQQNYRAYLLTGASVTNTAVVSTVNSYSTSQLYDAGTMKISPNGRKLAVANNNYSNSQSGGAFELWDFDNSTGAVTNSLGLLSATQYSNTIGNFGGSVEFSPDGTKLYGSHFYDLNTHYLGSLIQWNLCAGSPSAIAASSVALATSWSSSQGSSWFGSLQNARNGKVYVARYDGTGTWGIGVVNNPSTAGTACNFVDFGQSISPNTSWFSLPNFIGNAFVQLPPMPSFTTQVSNNFGCQSAMFTPPILPGNTVSICSNGYTLVSLSWNFGDPLSGSNNTSTVSTPIHQFTSLGTYTVKLILNYGCGMGTDTLKQLVNVNLPCINIASHSISCASLGSATVTPTVGIGPFSYTWLPTNQNNSVVAGLVPGNYTVIVYDQGSNFTYTNTLNFASVIPLTGSLVHSGTVTCNSGSTATGSYINLAGGSATQNYTWTNGSASYYTPTVSSLSAGLWNVKVKDALTGCEINDVFLIFQPSPVLPVILASTPTICAGGSISFSSQATGGTPGYFFQWTNGPPSSSHTVTENTAGTYIYSLAATDANTCTVTKTVSVNFIANPALVVSNASICPLETGTISVSGATSYTWSNNSNNTSISDNPLSTTVYTVTGEALTCTSVATATITLKAVPVPLIASNSPRCEQSQLQFFSNGGASYVWAGPQSFGSNAQNPFINSVQINQAGVYNLTVTAANSCTAATSVTVVVNTIPTVAATGATVCTTQTLNLGATSVAGATFLWNGPIGFSSGLQNAFLNNPPLLSTGNYTVKATSAQGCTNTAVANALVVPPPNLVTTLSSNSLCAQALNGSPNSIMMNATGGVTYTLSTPAHINYNSNPPWSLSSTPPYTPQIVVSTATLFGTNGVCTTSVTASFSVIPNPTVTVSNPTPVICAGETFTYTSNGAGSYVWSSSSPNYTSVSNGGVAVANPSINALFSIIGSSLGCQSALVTSSMTVYPLPIVSVTPTQTNICIGSPAVLVAYGNATSYQWRPPNYLSATSGATVLAKPNSEMQYIVIGSANNCTRLAVANVSVLALPLPTATANSKEVCLNDHVIFTGSGGLYYHWNGPNNISFSGQTATVTASSFIYSGEYTLTVTDQNGCINTAKTGFVINEFPSSGITGTKLTGCAPFCSDIELWTKSNSVNARFTVNGKPYNSNTFNYCFQTPGTYTIAGYFTDNKTNCQATESLVLSVPRAPQANFYWLPENPVESIEDVQFINSSLDENQVQWSWYFSNDKTYKPQTESASYFFRDAGTYPVALVVTNSAGCSDTIVKKVVIEGDFACYIPNAFTPNTDSKNEIFLPKVRGVHKYSLSIFNRWGEQVFYTQEASEGWDGEFKGQLAKSDVYAYKIVLTTVHGEHKEYAGQVTLYR